MRADDCSRRRVLKRCFLIVALFALFVSGPAFCESDANADVTKAGQPEAVDSKRDNNSPAAISDDAKTGNRHKEEKCHYDGPKWFASFYCFFAGHEKFWISFGTLVLAAFTTILGFATIFLARATKSLVTGAENTAQRQLRAYVFVRPVGTFFLYDGDSCRVTITFAFKNHGQTPAYRFLEFAEIRNFMVPTTVEIRTPDPIEPLTEISLGPGAEIEGTVWGIMDRNTLNELGSSFRKIHVTGVGRYVDAFGQARETKFCFYVENLGELLAGHTGTGGDGDGAKFWFPNSITAQLDRPSARSDSAFRTRADRGLHVDCWKTSAEMDAQLNERREVLPWGVCPDRAARFFTSPKGRGEESSRRYRLLSCAMASANAARRRATKPAIRIAATNSQTVIAIGLST